MSNADLDTVVPMVGSFVIGVIVMAVCAYFAARIAREKNRGVGEAIALGALLGLIGVVIVALLPSRTTAKRTPLPPDRVTLS